MKKRVVILGAGISGLTTAWYLSQTRLPLEITLLEKSARSGGWLHTDHTTGFHFEKGPRTFKVDKSPSMMRLVAELGLQKEVIWSEAKPHHRYLWHEGELQRFPTNPISFLFSPLTKGFLKALFSEWKEPLKEGDETVWEFVVRRFNYDVARLFFDPMVVGIFGGDIRQISVRACFPKLKAWEEKYGSVTKGFYHTSKQKKRESKFSEVIPSMPKSSIFSFLRGMEQLPQTLMSQMNGEIRYQQNVIDLHFEKDQILITTEKEQFCADSLFCALPVRETGCLFEKHAPEISKELLKIPSLSLGIVNLGYNAQVLPIQGFGYLTPTQAHEDILGVVFDSCVFSEHNRKEKQTRLTVKLADLGMEEQKYIEASLKGIRRHLGISQLPKAVSVKYAKRAIPQYGVGHLEKMAEMRELFRAKFPNAHLVGNYLQGVSVDSCIAVAKEAVEEWKKTN